MNYTEQNQKAEFIGGAIGAGCGLFVLVCIILFVIAAYVTQT